MVLVPTRELALQVAEAFSRYGAHLPKISVLPIYGGQSYTIQLKQLSRGAHIIVGTPGRVMDHLERKTLNLDNLKAAVLKADWYDPDINPKLADFCRHYGIHVVPCRPWTPRCCPISISSA